jgi:hypothetical protein
MTDAPVPKGEHHACAALRRWHVRTVPSMTMNGTVKALGRRPHHHRNPVNVWKRLSNMVPSLMWWADGGNA